MKLDTKKPYHSVMGEHLVRFEQDGSLFGADYEELVPKDTVEPERDEEGNVITEETRDKVPAKVKVAKVKAAAKSKKKVVYPVNPPIKSKAAIAADPVVVKKPASVSAVDAQIAAQTAK